ncbi:response regulator [Chloroflexota bacterium]
MDKIEVVLVDDHAVFRDGVRALLDLHDDIEIVGEASEGKEAIEIVEELTPDVVIMDISMPGMDGIEATRRIMKRNPEVKVLVLSQHDNRKYILLAIKAGVAGYIPKRALGSDLVWAIRAVYKGDYCLYPSAIKEIFKEYLKQTGEEPFDLLTNREREILKLIADGHTSREIADLLLISLKTVLGYRTKIMGKLNIHNRTELIKYAMRKGLLNVDI